MVASKHDSYDWLKLLLDNKWLILALFSFLGSATGNVMQEKTIKMKSDEVIATQQQVANVADNYHKTYANSEQKQESAKTIIIKNDCSVCQNIMNAHISEFH